MDDIELCQIDDLWEVLSDKLKREYQQWVQFIMTNEEDCVFFKSIKHIPNTITIVRNDFNKQVLVIGRKI